MKKKAKLSSEDQDELPEKIRRTSKTNAFAAYAGCLREGAGKTREQINAELRGLRGE